MGISALATKGLGYLKTGGRVYGNLILGTGQDKLTKVVQNQIKNRAAVGDSYVTAAAKGVKNGFKEISKGSLGGIWHSIKTTPRLVQNGWKLGAKAATAAGKSSIVGGLKGSLSAIGKRMPLLGGILMLASEIPNIWNATKEQGLWAGVKETVKSGARVGAGMAGAGIGAALLAPIPVVGPILGGILGYMAGDKLASLFTGKSYSEKKMEQEEQIAQAQQQQQSTGFDTGTTNPFATMPTMTPEQLWAMQQQLYGNTGALSDDFMYLTMMNNLRA